MPPRWDGVETDGVRYHFPPAGPFCMMAHSFGGMRTLAFLKNSPAYAARVQAVVALVPTLLGTPGATPEWLRHTTSRAETGDIADAEYAPAGVAGRCGTAVVHG